MPSVIPSVKTLGEAWAQTDKTQLVVMVAPLIVLVVVYWGFLTAVNSKRAFTWTVFWLVLSGFIHSYLELSFTFFRDNQYFGAAMDLYSASDFRYGFPMEEGTAAMEAITALLDGPFCLIAAYAFVTKKPYYHPLVLVVSVMQMYGLTWFTLHPFFSDTPHMSSDPGLFWIILVAFNAPWSIFPTILAFKSFREITSRFVEAPKAKSA
ncbi:unnamed protein product [Aphanomyces euteiches]|uniref:EXPERA domain-containing protein n=1 Tax=Aphanomyces euteiches TaxID=100861 RepID=A0A6G0WPL3_9STRA|nr:hypothetical protein Ae201684_013090 [Aphanomyces euteiches]KAH9143423.1 hypothetical protein AeRB84_012576 [Aphanomyces euteiches]